MVMEKKGCPTWACSTTNGTKPKWSVQPAKAGSPRVAMLDEPRKTHFLRCEEGA